MKRFLVFILAFATVLCICGTSVYAYVTDDGAGNATENGDGIDDTLNVEGDYFNFVSGVLDRLSGGKTTLTGSVGGDIIGFFSNVDISHGEIGGSIRLAADTAVISDTSCRNITVASRDIVVAAGTQAKAVVIYATGRVEFSGSCDSLTVYASEAVIKGEVKSRAEINAGTVYFSPDAQINRVSVESENNPLTISGGNALESENLKGKITFEKINIWQDALSSMPSLILYAVLGALIIQLVFGKSTRESAVNIKEHPVRYCFSGFAMMIYVPSAALFIFMLSKNISIAILLVYAALTVVSQLFAGSILGTRFFPTMNRFLSSIMLTTTIAVLAALPYVGGLIQLASMLIAFGYFSNRVFPRRRVIVFEAKQTNDNSTDTTGTEE